jgi:hypothetical protein
MTDMTIDTRVAPDIPKIHQTDRRETIAAVARELARQDGYVFRLTSFGWLRLPAHARIAADIHPRSVWYVRRAIACYAIIKGR